jgi:hypothetical protein
MGKPKKEKKASKMTTEQALQRLFGKRGTGLLKKMAQELDDERGKRGKKKGDD